MRMVAALNAVSSQVWAAVLILLGMGTFALARIGHGGDVQSALVSAATGMIGGGIAMFQHQPKTETKENQPPA